MDLQRYREEGRGICMRKKDQRRIGSEEEEAEELITGGDGERPGDSIFEGSGEESGNGLSGGGPIEVVDPVSTGQDATIAEGSTEAESDKSTNEGPVEFIEGTGAKELHVVSGQVAGEGGSGEVLDM